MPVGPTLIAIGLAVTVYFFIFFDTSVTTERVPGRFIGGYYVEGLPSTSVENIGKLNFRQNGIIIGVSIMIVGAIFRVKETTKTSK